MHFTREPIIETIITPKEGFQLTLRNSHVLEDGEAYVVDAVEVVSFGTSYFFRSLEKPKSFLLPISDYQVIETREMRPVLKRPVVDTKTIKIGGGKKETKEDEGASNGKAAVVKEPKKRRQRRHRSGNEKATEEVSKAPQKEEKESANKELLTKKRPILPPPPLMRLKKREDLGEGEKKASLSSPQEVTYEASEEEIFPLDTQSGSSSRLEGIDHSEEELDNVTEEAFFPFSAHPEEEEKFLEEFLKDNPPEK